MSSSFCLLSQMGSTLKRKEFAPIGANSFIQEKILFKKDFVIPGSKRKVKKKIYIYICLSFIFQNWQKHVVPVNLNLGKRQMMLFKKVHTLKSLYQHRNINLPHLEGAPVPSGLSAVLLP